MNKISKIFTNIRKFFWAESLSPEQDLLAVWRERIFFIIFITVVLMGSIPLLSSISQAIQEERWINIVFYTLGYLIMIVIIVVRRIPFKIRTGIGLSVFYLFALLALLTIGPAGSGRVFLFALSIIATLLLGLRVGLAALALNIATISVVGTLAGKGQLEWVSTAPYAMEIWWVTCATFLWLNVVVTVSLAVLVHSLEKALRNEQKLSREVKSTNIMLENKISEKMKLETQLRQAQKMEAIGTLAGGIAHDFNNILFPVIGYAEMSLMNDMPEDSDVRRYLNEIIKGATRAKDLVQQILTFSRQQEQELKPLKVQFVIKEALKLLRSSIPTIIEIHQNIEKDCGLVMADYTQIHQVVMNLCTNAYHAMEEKGGILEVNLIKIELGVNDIPDKTDLKPGWYVRLSVSDTGCGVKNEIAERIFDPYFTTKEKGKGTGLGLSVVHGIVKGYGGEIKVHSEPGKGSIFEVYLPLVDTGKKEEEILIPKEIQGGSERILLIDDEEVIVTLSKQMLERLGYHVTAHTNSLEALETFQANPNKFDIVITDMTMPNMTGDRLAQELLNIRSDISIILCTGFSEKISKEKADALGIRALLLKPVAMRNLANTIRQVLDKEIVIDD